MIGRESHSTIFATIVLPTVGARIVGRNSFIFGRCFLNGKIYQLVDGGKIGRNGKSFYFNAVTPFSTILLSKDKKKKLGKTVKGWGIRARERRCRKPVEHFSLLRSEVTP